MKIPSYLIKNIGLVSIGAVLLILQPKISQARSLTVSSYPTIFANRLSPGSIGVGAAEGTLTPIGKPTRAYTGHIDPGNRVINKGFCSWNKAYTISVATADKFCLKALQRQSASTALYMRWLGLNPNKHTLAIAMGTDLWNQSPSAGPQFPRKYFQSLKKGLKGDTAFTWARVESFRNQKGQLSAQGLFGICKRSPYHIQQLALIPYSSPNWKWNCIKIDQQRRVKAIKEVFRLNSLRRGKPSVKKLQRKANTPRPITHKIRLTEKGRFWDFSPY